MTSCGSSYPTIDVVGFRVLNDGTKSALEELEFED